MDQMTWGEVQDWLGKTQDWLGRIETLVRDAGSGNRDPHDPVPENVMRALGDLARRVPAGGGGNLIARGACIAPGPERRPAAGGPQPRKES